MTLANIKITSWLTSFLVTGPLVFKFNTNRARVVQYFTSFSVAWPSPPSHDPDCWIFCIFWSTTDMRYFWNPKFSLRMMIASWWCGFVSLEERIFGSHYTRNTVSLINRIKGDKEWVFSGGLLGEWQGILGLSLAIHFNRFFWYLESLS